MLIALILLLLVLFALIFVQGYLYGTEAKRDERADTRTITVPNDLEEGDILVYHSGMITKLKNKGDQK
jgi:preprotein translocase subunit YajC